MPRHPKTLSSAEQWHAQFLDFGLPELRAEVLSTYAGGLASRGLPVVFSFHHLCLLLGVTPRYLASVVFSSSSHYRSFDIPKRSGGLRQISAPYPTLLQCQRWIARNILSHEKVHEAAHGYVGGRSIISNARKHLAGKELLKVDLKDFFPSIHIGRVIGYFKSIGYAPEISYFLGKICCLDDALPQGAATSPLLSNILLRHMDNRMARVSKEYGVTYTRYADDLAFSADSVPAAFSGIVDSCIKDSGFLVNPKKRFLIAEGRRKIIAGVDVSSGEMRAPREFRRQVRQQAHLAIKLGATEYIIKNRQNPNAMPELLGKLAYWLQVEPANSFAKMAFGEIRSMLKSSG